MAWQMLNTLKLTPTYPGGVEAFLGKWEDVMEDLEDVHQRPNKFLERTLLKAAITDESYRTDITNLDMMKPAPSPEVCKAEIRREGAKLEYKRKEEALRRAHHTSYQDHHVTDGALQLISSIQQRQWGGYKAPSFD